MRDLILCCSSLVTSCVPVRKRCANGFKSLEQWHVWNVFLFFFGMCIHSVSVLLLISSIFVCPQSVELTPAGMDLHRISIQYSVCPWLWVASDWISIVDIPMWPWDVSRWDGKTSVRILLTHSLSHPHLFVTIKWKHVPKDYWSYLPGSTEMDISFSQSGGTYSDSDCQQRANDFFCCVFFFLFFPVTTLMKL